MSNHIISYFVNIILNTRSTCIRKSEHTPLSSLSFFISTLSEQLHQFNQHKYSTRYYIILLIFHHQYHLFTINSITIIHYVIYNYWFIYIDCIVSCCWFTTITLSTTTSLIYCSNYINRYHISILISSSTIILSADTPYPTSSIYYYYYIYICIII